MAVKIKTVNRQPTPAVAPPSLDTQPANKQKRVRLADTDMDVDTELLRLVEDDHRMESPLTSPPSSRASSAAPEGSFLSDDDKIARPPGEAGRPGRAGYNLQEKMEEHWQREAFLELRASAFLRTRNFLRAD